MSLRYTSLYALQRYEKYIIDYFIIDYFFDSLTQLDLLVILT